MHPRITLFLRPMLSISLQSDTISSFFDMFCACVPQLGELWLMWSRLLIRSIYGQFGYNSTFNSVTTSYF